MVARSAAVAVNGVAVNGVAAVANGAEDGNLPQIQELSRGVLVRDAPIFCQEIPFSSHDVLPWKKFMTMRLPTSYNG